LVGANRIDLAPRPVEIGRRRTRQGGVEQWPVPEAQVDENGQGVSQRQIAQHRAERECGLLIVGGEDERPLLLHDLSDVILHWHHGLPVRACLPGRRCLGKIASAGCKGRVTPPPPPCCAWSPPPLRRGGTQAAPAAASVLPPFTG